MNSDRNNRRMRRQYKAMGFTSNPSHLKAPSDLERCAGCKEYPHYGARAGLVVRECACTVATLGPIDESEHV